MKKKRRSNNRGFLNRHWPLSTSRNTLIKWPENETRHRKFTSSKLSRTRRSNLKTLHLARCFHRRWYRTTGLMKSFWIRARPKILFSFTNALHQGYWIASASRIFPWFYKLHHSTHQFPWKSSISYAVPWKMSSQDIWNIWFLLKPFKSNNSQRKWLSWTYAAHWPAKCPIKIIGQCRVGEPESACGMSYASHSLDSFRIGFAWQKWPSHAKASSITI